jgi:membrane-associated phospholipid phosphatase
VTHEVVHCALLDERGISGLGIIGHRRGMTTTATRRDTAMPAAAAASGGVATLLLMVVVALRSAQGQQWDNDAMATVVAGRDTKLALLSGLGYVSIGAVVMVALGCGVVALLRGKVRLAIAAAIVIGGADLSTQALKHSLLERPDFGLGVLNSLPSGHTTVVASAVGAALLVAPGGLRPLVAVAGGFATTLTGASTIVAGWHRPADVIAALAVSLAWTGVVALFIHGPRAPVTGTLVSALLGCAVALAFLVAIGVRPAYGWVGFTQASLVLGAVTAVTAVFVFAAAAVSPAE